MSLMRGLPRVKSSPEVSVAAQQGIDALQSIIDTAHKKPGVGNLKGQIATLQGQIDDLRAQLKPLEDRLATLNQNLSRAVGASADAAELMIENIQALIDGAA